MRGILTPMIGYARVPAGSRRRDGGRRMQDREAMPLTDEERAELEQLLSHKHDRGDPQKAPRKTPEREEHINLLHI